VSLRGRLLAAVGVVALLALLAADIATYSSIRAFLLGRVDAGLQASHGAVEQSFTGHGFGPGPFGSGGPEGPVPVGPQAGAPLPGDDGGLSASLLQLAPGTFVELRTTAGQVLMSLAAYERGGTSNSPALPGRITGFSAGANPGGEPTVYFDAASARAGGPEFRVRASEIGEGEVMVLAVSLADTNATLHRLLLVELAVTAGALALAGLAGWWLVRLGMRPLAAIEATAGRIAAGELGSRVPGEGRRTEVGRLAGALNVMLVRIEAAFAQRDANEAALRESETRLRRFVADASHELRTPIAAVSAYAELFGRGADSNPADLSRLMEGIHAETDRMSGLVQDLLLLARMDEGLPLERVPVELVGLAAEAVEAARAVGPGWHVTLEAERPVEVVGEAGRLRQVLDNLLGNVRAHTPPGTHAAVRVGSDAGDAVLTVSDDGPGLTPDQAQQVFERFYRVDTSRSRSRSSGGAGLGLSIVAAIAAAHGGTVTAGPAEPRGARFEVRLPLAPDPVAMDPVPTDAGAPAVSGGDHSEA
jgi:two-component system OmpR family sensor kinase